MFKGKADFLKAGNYEQSQVFNFIFFAYFGEFGFKLKS